jgi:phospholipid-binding lipoprotein MlaA
MSRAEIWMGCLGAVGLATLVSSCAGVPHDTALPVYDPWEQTNRVVLKGNQIVLDPVATVVKQTPGPVLNRIRDLNDNLNEPRIFGNDILQGRFGAAGITLQRFVFNSIFGLGGLVDVATPGGLPMQTGDFGQTLFVWGVAAGPYVVRPYYGPATLRDSIGGAVDTIGDPLGFVVGYWLVGWPWAVGTAGVSAVAHLGQWKQAENASIDFYSFLRSDFYQTRRADLREALGLPPGVESPATPGPAPAAKAAARPAQGSQSFYIPPPQ